MESARVAVMGDTLERTGSLAAAGTVAPGSQAATGSKLKKPGAPSGAGAGMPAADDGGGGGGGSNEPRSESVGLLAPVPPIGQTAGGRERRTEAAPVEGGAPSEGALRPSASVRSFAGHSGSLLRRRRLRRNLSATAAAPGTFGGRMGSAASASSLSTRSLDRKTLLRHKQPAQLQPSDREWVRSDLRRGCVHVHDRRSASCLRPVLCTLDTSAGEIAHRLSRLGGRAGVAVRVTGEPGFPMDFNGPLRNCDDASGRLNFGVRSRDGQPPPSADRLKLLLLANDGNPSRCTGSPAEVLTTDVNSGSDVESSPLEDLSSGPGLGERRDSFGDDMMLGTDASALSPAFDNAADGLDTPGSSSDELELDCPSPKRASSPETEPGLQMRPADGATAATIDDGGIGGASQAGAATEGSDPTPTLYVQLHGETARRLELDEKPLRIQNDYLFKLGFKDPWRVQEEGMDSEIGSLIRFYAGEYLQSPHLTGRFGVCRADVGKPCLAW